MPGRREFGVLDIKAELLDIAVLQPRWASPAQGRELWAAAGDGWRSPGLSVMLRQAPGSRLQAPRQAQGLRSASLLLPLSQNPLSSPLVPGLRALDGWEAVRCYHTMPSVG